MPSQYEQARAEAEQRRRSQSLELRARKLLRELGWSATREEIIAGVELLAFPKRTPESDQLIGRQRIADMAVQLQTTERARERRLSPEEVAEVGRRYGVPEEKRPLIRERIADLLKEKPDHAREMMRVKINAEFGVDIQPENFRVSYWIPAGGGAVKPAAKARKPAAEHLWRGAGQAAAARGPAVTVPPAVEARRPAAKRAAAEKPALSAPRLLLRLLVLEELPGERAVLRLSVDGFEFELHGARA